MSRFSNLEFDRWSENYLQNDLTAPRDESFFVKEARLGFENARFEHSLRGYAKALEFNPMNTSAWAGQVYALIELGEYREANLWSDKALERFPDNPEILSAKAVALARLNDTGAALAYADSAVEARGDLPVVWLARAEVLFAKREKVAEYSLERALSLAPGDWFVHLMASKIYYYYKFFVKAFKYAKKAIELNSEVAICWLQFGLCQLELGMYPQAKSSFARALELSPDSHHIREAIKQLDEQGSGSRLLRFFKKILGN
ncbi:MAG: tetratricopeptide repeat protein [Verrucomicrobiia bacterium]